MGFSLFSASKFANAEHTLPGRERAELFLLAPGWGLDPLRTLGMLAVPRTISTLRRSCVRERGAERAWPVSLALQCSVDAIA